MPSGIYKRTNFSWNKGKKMSKEFCDTISNSLIGNTYCLGRKLSEKHKRKIGKSVKGEKNSFFGRHHSKKTKRKISETKEKSKKCKGKNHYNWQGGKSFEPYGLKFNNELKEKIRKRDNYICQKCKYAQKQLKYKLDCHHIDYNKQNNNSNNLITLCRSCHCKTNYNREYWTNYFKDKLI